MSVDEGRRLLLHDAARDAWGAEAALVLMEMLPPTGWADVATKQDLQAISDRLEDRIDRLGERFDHQFAAVRLELDAKLAVGQRRSIQWNVATLVAVVSTMAAIVKL